MIGFLHPWLLAALPAVALPLVLHLLARREPPTVSFPATRYLQSATAEHQRRLRLRHWLLLLLRMLIILALVLAAAGPTLPLRQIPGHAPSALVIVLDNSASSGAVSGGTPELASLARAARNALGHATAEDALWLLPADGRPRRGDARQLAAMLDSIEPDPRRLDLGAAVTLAGQTLRGDARPGSILILSDVQASAVSAAASAAPLIVGRPDAPPPANHGVMSLDPGAQPWTRDGGKIVVGVTGDSSASVPVTLRAGRSLVREVLVRAGDSVSVPLPAPSSGWYLVSAELAPDELRLDDRRESVLRVAPVAAVACDRTDRFLAIACDVLQQNHRLVPGSDITLGTLGRGRSIVLPPDDPARLGALNRALAQRGSGWRFGELRLDATTTDSGALLGRHRVSRRYTLVPGGSGRTGVVATAGGEPWAVRSRDLVLLGSRLDSAWTDLPLSTEFMPFMDRLVNRVIRGELAMLATPVGDAVPLPDVVTEVRQGDRRWKVEGGDYFTPSLLGAYYLLAGGDTVGALTAGIDPRESQLRRATDADLRRLWRGARITTPDQAADAAFSAGARADLRGPLLWLAVVAALIEVLIATVKRPAA